MAEKTFNTKLKLRYDSYENWIANDPQLLAGEIALAAVSTKQDGAVEHVPSVLIKCGDGSHKYSELDYVFAKAADVISAAKSETALTAFINSVIADAGIATSEAMEALASKVTTAEGEIDALQTTVGDADSGLVKDVAALEALVGDTKVADQITAAITALKLDDYFSKIFQVGSLDEITDSSLAVGDIAIVKTVIYEDTENTENNKYSYAGYVYNGTAWAAMDGNYSANNVYFDSDMLVTKEIGYITLTDGQGYVPSEGKNLVETFEAMFVKEQNPETTQPKVSLTFAQAKAYEVGTVVSPSYSATFNAGSYTYGPATGVTVTAWEISDTAGHTATTASGSFDDVTVGDSTSYKITAKATHTEGAVPVTNKKNPYEAGKIVAGTKSVTSNAITGYRSFFYGVLDTSSTEVSLTSTTIRGLTNGGAYNASKTFTLNGSDTAKRIVVAIPSASTRNGLQEVILTSAMNTPVTDSYVKTAAAVQVEGANGATAVDYDVYVYEPSKIDAGEVHKITLA